jgi:glutathione S-transferase
MRYVARKAKLIGSNEKEIAQCDMMYDTVCDLRRQVVMLAYTKKSEYPEKLKQFAASLPDELTAYSKYLEGKEWFAGSSLTYCDFLFYEMFLEISLMVPGCLDKFSNLQQFLMKFETLPNIAKYMEEKDYKLPWNNTQATFR